MNIRDFFVGLVVAFILITSADYIAVKKHYSVSGCHMLGQAVKEHPVMLILSLGWVTACGKDIE